MARDDADLTTCDTDPIHMIGAIQGIGALVAADARSLEIRFASANTAEILGTAPDALIGRKLGGWLGSEALALLSGRPLTPTEPDLFRPIEMRIAGRLFECLAHRQGDHLILEFVEPDEAQAAVWEDEELRQRIVTDLARAESIEDLAPVAADLVRRVNGFDRVMVYRFAPDKHGAVIAESTERADRYLGLHYPASDIPEPARRHFQLNLIRIIADIVADPVPLIGPQGRREDVPDLTFSKLRATPPVHVEYLTNMGVAASMSISLTANDRLWGLIACHHYAPRRLGWGRLRLCELLGSTLSTLLQSIENTTKLRKSIAAEKCAFAIEAGARAGKDLAALVGDAAPEVLALTGGEGLVLEALGERITAGRVPASLPPLGALAETAEDGIAATDHLAEHVPLGEEERRAVAGLAHLSLSEDGADRLLILRPPFERVINWAGKPEKPMERDAEGRFRLSPRRSFELWREERRDRSRPFDEADREVLRILRRALHAIASLNRERAAVAAREAAEGRTGVLRMALMEAARKSSMGELASALAHELSQPLSAIANYVAATRNQLARAGNDPGDMVRGFMDETVSEAMRAGDLLRRLRDFVSNGDLMPEWIDIAEVMRRGVDLALASEAGAPAEIDFDLPPDGLPQIWGDPVQLGQVILNLVRNSIIAMEETPERRIILSAQLVNADMVSISVCDTGPGIPPEMKKDLFEPFRSSTSLGMGIGLSLCRSIVEAHGGRIALVDRQDGAEIAFRIPIRSADGEAEG